MRRVLKCDVRLRFLSRFLNKAFSRKYLLATNMIISLFRSGLGDCIEQNYERYNGKIKKLDYIRTRNISIAGTGIGALCHYWYKGLDTYLPGYTLKIVMQKVLLDQLIASPVYIGTLFIVLAFLEGAPKETFVRDNKDKAIKLYLADWILWPPAQFINFYFLPNRYRVLFDNVVSIGYDVYTSRVKYE